MPLHKIGKTTEKVNEKHVEQGLTAGKQDVTTGISISEAPAVETIDTQAVIPTDSLPIEPLDGYG